MERRGAAIVEAVIILPLICLLTLGMIEVGCRMLTKQSALKASRTGARYASQVDSTVEEATKRAQEAFWGIVPYEDIPAEKVEKVDVTVTDNESGQPVIVHVYCEFEDVAPFPPFWKGPVTGTTTFRKEG